MNLMYIYILYYNLILINDQKKKIDSNNSC